MYECQFYKFSNASLYDSFEWIKYTSKWIYPHSTPISILSFDLSTPQLFSFMFIKYKETQTLY